MDMIAIVLVVLLVIMGVKCISLSVQYRTLRKRATLLAALIIKDGTRRVQSPASPVRLNPGQSGMMWRDSMPLVEVKRWDTCGFIGDPIGASHRQWSCAPAHELKWDGAIPYCD